MKLLSQKRQHRGMAVIVVLALVSILLIYITANIRTLNQLGRDLKLIEQKQLHRWQTPQPSTNSVRISSQWIASPLFANP
jgi:hypothetical protein